MKLPAAIKLVTHTNERTELNVNGFVTCGDNFIVEYSTPEYSAKITVSGGSAEICRYKSSEYTLTLKEGLHTRVTVNEISIPVFTKKLTFKATKTCARLLAEYTLGGEGFKLILSAQY